MFQFKMKHTDILIVRKAVHLHDTNLTSKEMKFKILFLKCTSRTEVDSNIK
jgi:hypothetical protein